ncbi:MAG: hypothetical protein ABI068_00790 [Ktedonobacterales bacterium]
MSILPQSARIWNSARVVARSLAVTPLVAALAWATFSPLAGGTLAASAAHIGVATQMAHTITQTTPILFHLGPNDVCGSGSIPCP